LQHSYPAKILTFSNINFAEERIISSGFVNRIFFLGLMLAYFSYFRVIISNFASCLKIKDVGGTDKNILQCIMNIDIPA